MINNTKQLRLRRRTTLTFLRKSGWLLLFVGFGIVIASWYLSHLSCIYREKIINRKEQL